MRLFVLPEWVKVALMKSTLIKYLSVRRFLRKRKLKHCHPRMNICKRELCMVWITQLVHLCVHTQNSGCALPGVFSVPTKHCMSVIHILETSRVVAQCIVLFSTANEIKYLTTCVNCRKGFQVAELQLDSAGHPQRCASCFSVIRKCGNAGFRTWCSFMINPSGGLHENTQRCHLSEWHWLVYYQYLFSATHTPKNNYNSNKKRKSCGSLSAYNICLFHALVMVILSTAVECDLSFVSVHCMCGT